MKKKRKTDGKTPSPGLTFSVADVDSKHHPFSHPVGYRWMYEKMIRCQLIHDWHSPASRSFAYRN
jgi:hypothetical protein